jgi:hypothetical protein
MVKATKMTTKASLKLLAASLGFSVLVLTSVIGRAQIRTPTANWVNIKDPKFGAIGNGSHDDTAAIQAAIDHAFAHNLPAVYCPAGTYKTSNTIWLDPPGNFRATYFTGAGYVRGTTLTITTVGANSVAVGDYIKGSGVAPATIITALGTGSGGTGTYIVNNLQTVGSSGSPVSLTANNSAGPTMSQFTMAFFGDSVGGGNAHLSGCQIQPTFNNAIAFVVGTGQSMRVSDISIVGAISDTSLQYRSLLPSSGVGIGIGSAGGGAATTLIENTNVANFYALYKTAAIGDGDLSEGNTFRKVGGRNGYFGIFLNGTQAYVDDIVEPLFNDVTVAIDSEFSKQVNVFGGNLSATTAVSNSFGVTSISSLFTADPCTGSGAGRCFTATIASPDVYVGSVYNSYMINTAHFGVIPLTLISWNSSTNVGTFGVWMPWLLSNYGYSGIVSSAMQSDIQAVNTLYAAERVQVARGVGIVLDGVHIENPQTCTSLLMTTDVWRGQNSNEIKNPYFNYDPSGVSSGTTAQRYCQQVFPFIGQEANGPFSVKLKGGNWGVAANPLIIDAEKELSINGSQLGLVAFNIRPYDDAGCTYGQIENPTGVGWHCSGREFPSTARGAGRWDDSYFFPYSWPNASLHNSELTSDYCGYEPCPWTTPNLSPTLYSLVGGTLGALGTYPPIACRTVFKSVDWNTGSLSHLFLRSASCPGYSWGQKLTNSLVGGTLTWSYMAESDVLYLDVHTIWWMFPGLGISLDNGSGPQPYIVTGVYPYLGYVTVIWAGSNSGGGLQGTNGTVYSCSSSCTIGQAPFSWAAY